MKLLKRTWLSVVAAICFVMLITSGDKVFAAGKVQVYKYDYATEKLSEKPYDNKGKIKGMTSFGLMAKYSANEKATFTWEVIDGTDKIASVIGRSTYDRLGTVIGLKKGTVKIRVTAYVGKSKVGTTTCKVTVTDPSTSTKPLKALYTSDSKIKSIPNAKAVAKDFKKIESQHPRVLGDAEDFKLAHKFMTYAQCVTESGFNTAYEKAVKNDIDTNYDGKKISEEYWQYIKDVFDNIIYRSENKMPTTTYKYKLSGGSLIDTVIKELEDEVTIRGFCYRLAVAYKQNVEDYNKNGSFSTTSAYNEAKSDADTYYKQKKGHATRIVKLLKNMSDFKDWNPSHFLDTGEMAYIFGLAYDWTYDYMSQDERDKYAAVLIKKGIEPGQNYIRSYKGQQAYNNNWSAVNCSGIGTAAIAVFEYDKELCGQQIADSSRLIPIFINQMAPEGGFSEGISYWTLSWRFITNFTSSLKCSTGDDYGITDANGAKASMFFPMYMKGPSATADNFTTYNFGDTYLVEKGVNASLFWLCDNYMDDGDFTKTSNIVSWYKTTYTNRLRYSEATVQEMIWFPSLLSKCGSKLKAPSKVTDSDLLKWGLTNNKTFFYSDKITNKLLAQCDLMSAGVVSGKGDKLNFITYSGSFTDKNAIYFATKDSNTNSAHRDMDAGSFIYDALGTRWVTDWGKTVYDDNRYKYYVKRAEGHSTVVINPGAYDDQNNSVEDEVTGTSIISRSDTKITSTGGYIVYDISNSYNTEKLSDGTLVRNNNSVLRGFKLLEKGKRLLIQDEIQLEQAGDIYWFLQTAVKAKDFSISKDGKTAILTKENVNGKKVKLKAELKVTTNNSKAAAKFTTMKYETMASAFKKYTVNKTFASEHSSERKLAIHVSADKNGKIAKVSKCTIAVVLTPIYSNSDLSDKMPSIKPLSTWTNNKSKVAELSVTDGKSKKNLTECTINVGDKFTLSTKVRPIYAKNKSLAFKSSNKKVAKVSSNGVITGVKCGSARITIQTKDGSNVKKYVDITVNPGKSSVTGTKFKASPHIRLKFKKVAGADEYHLYTSSSKNGTYKLAKRVTVTEMTLPYTAGKTIYYKVQASVKVDGQRVYGPMSEPFEVK